MDRGDKSPAWSSQDLGSTVVNNGDILAVHLNATDRCKGSAAIDVTERSITVNSVCCTSVMTSAQLYIMHVRNECCIYIHTYIHTKIYNTQHIVKHVTRIRGAGSR